jgi:predicted nucleic acid-binding protein
MYLDASAAAKLAIEEAESPALEAYVDAQQMELMSSRLLETELRRVATRLGADQAAMADVLARMAFIELSRGLFHEAGLLPGAHLRSLDAIHIATAIRIEAEVLVAYDKRLLEAASQLGLEVASPR